MGRMDLNALRYMSKDELRTLQAVEQGMKNHDIVPVELISSIAALKHGGAFKCLQELLRNKLIKHDRKKYDGYTLNYLGYDYLALNALRHRKVVKGVGRQIGVGKESDVFIGVDDAEEKQIVLKMHRLGRTSFRKIKEKRDYLQHRKSANWLYLSRLAATKEFVFMKVLKDAGFRVPEPIDQNRHCVVMNLIDAYPLTQVRELKNAGKVFARLMEMHIRLAQCGLVHCDFNEFNVMIDEDEELTLIDFPQMVSTVHENAGYYFDRDIQQLRVFFERRYDFKASSVPTLADVGVKIMQLDLAVQASGFSKEDMGAFDSEMENYRMRIKDGGERGDNDNMYAGGEARDGEDEEDEDEEEDEEEEEEEEEEGEEESGGAERPSVVGETMVVGGTEFHKLEITGEDELPDDEAGAAGAKPDDGEEGEEGEDEDEEDEGGWGQSKPRGEVMESSYDREQDVRRAWRFSGKPSGGNRGSQPAGDRPGRGGKGGGKGGTYAPSFSDGSSGWKKSATNRVKDRERRKINTNIKESVGARDAY